MIVIIQTAGASSNSHCGMVVTMPASHAGGRWFYSRCGHALFLLLLPDHPIALHTRSMHPIARYHPLHLIADMPVKLIQQITWHSFSVHPVRSDKIRARILDLGSGAARRALQNLCPKSARILSAAITRMILLPAGVRGLMRT